MASAGNPKSAGRTTSGRAPSTPSTGPSAGTVPTTSRTSPSDANVAAAIGIQGTSPNPLNYGPPNLSFTNFGNMVDGNPVVRRDQSSALRDAVTVVRGLHSLTFGGEYRRIQSNPITDTNGRGAFVFSGLLTSGFDDNTGCCPAPASISRTSSSAFRTPPRSASEAPPITSAPPPTAPTWWTIGSSAPTSRSTWACATNISRRTPRSTTACPTWIWPAASPARP